MPLSANLAVVDPLKVWSFWPFARDLIKRAVHKTDLCDFPTVEAEILAGQQLLWLAWKAGGLIDAACCTKIVGIRASKVCVLVACAGKGDWPSLMAPIEQYAQAEGCKAVRIYGRTGWKRVLTGYASKYAIMDKELK